MNKWINQHTKLLYKLLHFLNVFTDITFKFVMPIIKFINTMAEVEMHVVLSNKKNYYMSLIPVQLMFIFNEIKS